MIMRKKICYNIFLFDGVQVNVDMLKNFSNNLFIEEAAQNVFTAVDFFSTCTFP